jgi:hypothetical protein
LEEHRILDGEHTSEITRQLYRRKLLSEALAQLAEDVNLDLKFERDAEPGEEN